MSPRLKNITIRNLISALERDGFTLKRSSGSHRTYQHPVSGIRVTLPYHHAGETAMPGLINEVLKSTKWTEDDLIRLKLMRK